MAAKFKVGDQVVGNALADAHYNHTVRGWRGEVVKVWDGEFRCADDVVEWLLEFPYDDIVVRGDFDGQIMEFYVNSACFDLVEIKQETHVIAAAPQFKRILRSGDRLIVFWQDGTKTIVRRSPDEPDSNYAAFTAALAIKLYGSNSALKRIIEKNVEYQDAKKPKQKEPEQKPMRFKVGDLVRTRKDLVFEKDYGGISFIDGMQIDKETIRTADLRDRTYRLDNGYWYSEEMLVAVGKGGKE